jgi:glucokinase
MVVLGGGVTEGLPELIDMVRDHVQRRALAAAKASLKIVKGQLGSDAIIVGAALMARDHLSLDG